VRIVATKYILAGLALAFLIGGAVRLFGDPVRARPQGRTWLLIGIIFGLVTVWLFSQA